MATVTVGVDKFEVSVEDATGAMLPHISHEGRNYCVASPGETFVVRVRQNPANSVHKTYYRRRDAACLPKICSMSVDGESVGYDMDLVRQQIHFDGFWVNHNEMRKFIFAHPKFTVANETSEEAQETSVGVIEVEMYPSEIYACPVGCCHQCEFLGFGTTILPDIPTKEAAEVKSKQDKKFFTKPSLSIVGGVAVTQKCYRPSTHYQEVVGGASSKVKIHCETADTLLLRKVLKMTNPEHAVIVEKARETIRSRNRELEESDGSRREKEAKPSPVEGNVLMPGPNEGSDKDIVKERSQRGKRKAMRSLSNDFEDVIESLNGDYDSDCVTLSLKKSKRIHVLD